MSTDSQQQGVKQRKFENTFSTLAVERRESSYKVVSCPAEDGASRKIKFLRKPSRKISGSPDAE